MRAFRITRNHVNVLLAILITYGLTVLCLYLEDQPRRALLDELLSERAGLAQLRNDLEESNRVELDGVFQALFDIRQQFFIREVELSAYTASIRETNSDPTHTAIMERPKPGWTVAVSRDLLYLLGKKIYIEGVGIRRVNDLMNERYTNTIDVLKPNRISALRFGRKMGRVVIIDNDQGPQGREEKYANLLSR